MLPGVSAPTGLSMSLGAFEPMVDDHGMTVKYAATLPVVAGSFQAACYQTTVTTPVAEWCLEDLELPAATALLAQKWASNLDGAVAVSVRLCRGPTSMCKLLHPCAML